MKEWFIRLALIVFGFAVALGAAELGLRAFGPPIVTYPPGFTEPDKNLGWRGVPNAELINKVGPTPIALKRNSHGFSDKERTYEKGNDTFRILVLGDSFVEAIQVPLEEKFPYILEQKLNSERGRRFEVLNLGIGGYGTDQEYLMLKYHGVKYQPDWVILALYIGNDILENSSTLVVDGHPTKPHFVLINGELKEVPFTINDRTGADKILFSSVKDLFRRLLPSTYYLVTGRISSTSTPLLVNVLRAIGLMGSEPVAPQQSTKPQPPLKEFTRLWYGIYAKEDAPQWQDAWEVTKALLLEMRHELELKKIGFLVVVIPMELEFRAEGWKKTPYEDPRMRDLTFDERKPERILANFLGANNIGYLLLRPEFEKYTKETGKDLYLQDAHEIHWNDNGHRFVAELVYKQLQSALYQDKGL